MDKFVGKKEVVLHDKKHSKIDPRSRFRVPYVLYADPNGKYETAIYVNHLGPSFATLLIQKYFELDKRVKTICMFIVYWARGKRLLGASKNYISSYALILMTIFFLQIQNPPVIDSIQSYADKVLDVVHTGDFPSFQGMLMHKPERDEWRRYKPMNVVLDTVNFNFAKVDLAKLARDLGYPKNNESPGELLIKFFYYFGIDYPVLYLNTK
eukprot:TRINITY_DN5508_c0_g2_i1.p1 TRINITY_DN5508_c0_g2~~TRINITY_DN5508_c0_g2_i1.p1  ORF type:complete len:210 (-),score=37.97 TRINITY_DN5508_c0_g2_i1:264-893(-)